MKRRNIITTLALTLALGVGATAYAATASPRNTNPLNTTNDTTSSFRRMGGMMGTGGYDMMTSMLKNKLNMSDKEIEDALNSGKHMWEIAEEKGMSNEEFRNAMLEERTKAIDGAVSSGEITKEEGERFKEDLKNNIENCIGVGSGSGNGFSGMMRRGRGGRGCGSNFN
ncbi:hypothetical protein [uncultured Clostridium sp.]|uniref:hypothetical protein n=1 Tax=uncultured Clostridium sp. TaxID=59620 RepID=UPI0028E46F7C|nr:hypothetical protein [uncultured Clostridium sp.]